MQGCSKQGPPCILRQRSGSKAPPVCARSQVPPTPPAWPALEMVGLVHYCPRVVAQAQGHRTRGTRRPWPREEGVPVSGPRGNL